MRDTCPQGFRSSGIRILDFVLVAEDALHLLLIEEQRQRAGNKTTVTGSHGIIQPQADGYSVPGCDGHRAWTPFVGSAGEAHADDLAFLERHSHSVYRAIMAWGCERSAASTHCDSSSASQCQAVSCGRHRVDRPL